MFKASLPCPKQDFIASIRNKLDLASYTMDYHSTTNPSSSGSSSAPKNGREKRTGGKKSNGGVKLSTDPQSVAARERRHRISDRFKILQSLVPGGTKMDTVSMLEEAINYVKFLKNQILLHQTIMNSVDDEQSLDYHLPAGSASLPTEQPSYLDSNLSSVVHPSSSLPCPDSYFQADENYTHFDAFDSKNYYF